LASDLLTDVAAVGRQVRNWRAMLRHGLEAGALADADEAVAETIEARLRTRRPLAAAAWIAEQEAAGGAPRKPGPKPRQESGRGQVYCHRNCRVFRR
jgi:putative transposase